MFFLSQILFFFFGSVYGTKAWQFYKPRFWLLYWSTPSTWGGDFFWTLSGGIFVQAFRGDFAILFHFFVLMKKFWERTWLFELLFRMITPKNTIIFHCHSNIENLFSGLMSCKKETRLINVNFGGLWEVMPTAFRAIFRLQRGFQSQMEPCSYIDSICSDNMR